MLSANIREYFRIQMENGRTEEEICSSLETVLHMLLSKEEGMARQSRNFYKKPHRKNGIFKTIATVISAIVVLCIVFGGTIMFSFSKGKGLIFGAAKKYEINDVRTITPDSAKTIIIKTASTDTSILPSDSEIIKGSLVGNVRATSPDHVPTLKITRSGDTIIIEEKREVLGVIGFYWEDVKLDISIPESFKGAVEFEEHQVILRLQT